MSLAANPVDLVLPILQRKRAAAINGFGVDIVGTDQDAWIALVLGALGEAIIMKAIQDIHPTVATNEAWDVRYGAAALNDPNGLWPSIISRSAFPTS